MILYTLVFAAVVSAALSFVPNRSNFPSFFMIPLLASLLTKYVLGDWDTGFVFTGLDVGYWASILLTSYFTMLLLQRA